MLASISFGPMFLAIAAGRWLDRSGPRAPMLASRLSVMAAAGCAILLPASDLGIAPLFGACVLTGLSFMLTNVVIQRLTGDVTTPKNRRFAFTALSLTTASSNLAAPVVAVSTNSSRDATGKWFLLNKNEIQFTNNPLTSFTNEAFINDDGRQLTFKLSKRIYYKQE